MLSNLQKREANGGSVKVLGEGEYALNLNPPAVSKYGLAQLDDYMHLPRRKFPHQPPLSCALEARVSAKNLPGTWGFGLWNDPFGFVLGGGGMTRALPVLPNAAWFFYGSLENQLSLRDDQPGAGFHAKTFRAPRLPGIASLLVFPGLPLLLCPASARLLRRLARTLIKEDAVRLDEPDETWHRYSITWLKTCVRFYVDDDVILETEIVPQGPLGLVIWIDNQYFRFGSDGKIGFGFLKVEQSEQLQIRNLVVGRV